MLSTFSIPGSGGKKSAGNNVALFDLRAQLIAFGKLHDVLAKSHADKVILAQTFVDLLNQAASAGRGNAVASQRLAAAALEYRNDVAEPVAAFVAAYAKFKDFAEKAKAKARNRVQPSDFASVEKIVLEALALATTGHKLSDPMPTSSSSSSSGYSSGFGPFDGLHRRGGYTTYGTRLSSMLSEAHSRLNSLNSKGALGADGKSLIDALTGHMTKLRHDEVGHDSKYNRIDSDAYGKGTLADIRSLLDEKRRELEDKSGRSFAGDKSTPEDFLRFAADQPEWWGDTGISFDPSTSDPFDSLIKVGTLYARLGPHMVELLKAASEEVVGLIKGTPKDDAAAFKVLERVAQLIANLGQGLMLAPLEGKKPQEIDTLGNELRNNSQLLFSGRIMGGVTQQQQGAPGYNKSSSSSTVFSSNDGSGRTQRYTTTFSTGYSGSNGSSSGSSGSGSNPASASGGMGGFMYRRLDRLRLRSYALQMENFETSVNDAANTLLTRAAGHRERLEAQQEGLQDRLRQTPDDDTGARDMLKRSLREAKLNAIKAYCDAIRRTVGEFVAMHVAFVVKRHRDGMAYMEYWFALSEVEGMVEADAKEVINKYMDIRKNLVASTHERLVNDVRKEIQKALSEGGGGGGTQGPAQGGQAGGGAAANSLMLDNEQEAEVNDRFTGLMVWVSDQAERVDRLYTNGTPGFADTMMDPAFLLIYGLKALRFGIAYYALFVAGRVFQRMYDGRVYARDDPPPHPLRFIGLFMAVDVAINLVVLSLLVFSKHMFKTVHNEFPVDGQLLAMWMTDYLLTTLVVFTLAYIIGEVVRRKKYFRYKYEGDRGIRAMQRMVMYVYGIVLFIPFFRLIGG